MNATATALVAALPATVAELVVSTGKSETTVRKTLKELVAQGLVIKTDKTFSVPVVEVAETTEAPTAAGKKKYRRHEVPTTRTVRKNQITGFDVQVVKGTEWDENPPAKWITICLEHDTIGGSELVLDAHWLSTYPTFCPTCTPLLEGKVGRRRNKKA